MRAKVQVSLTDAWETWEVEIPDDYELDKLNKLIDDNELWPGEIELLGVVDTGNYGIEIEEISVVDGPTFTGAGDDDEEAT